MKSKVITKMSDEELLKSYDNDIEFLHIRLANHRMFNSGAFYDVANDLVAKSYQDEISAAERARKALIERMSVKHPKEPYYKTYAFIEIISALILAGATVLAALLAAKF